MRREGINQCRLVIQNVSEGVFPGQTHHHFNRNHTFSDQIISSNDKEPTNNHKSSLEQLYFNYKSKISSRCINRIAVQLTKTLDQNRSIQIVHKLQTFVDNAEDYIILVILRVNYITTLNLVMRFCHLLQDTNRLYPYFVL